MVDRRKGDDNIHNTLRPPVGQGMKNIHLYFVDDLTYPQIDNMKGLMTSTRDKGYGLKKGTRDKGYGEKQAGIWKI